MQIFYQSDCDLSLIKAKKVVIIGYGSQGHAHAQNLRDSGVDVKIALRDASSSKQKALEDGFEVGDISTLCKNADIIVMLAPDEEHKCIYEEHILPVLDKQILAFAHGFNIHYGYIKCPNPSIMIAPKGPGHALRARFVKGSGLPALIACEEKEHFELCKSYAAAIGSGRVGIIQTSFKNETQTDLFGEQAVLCGGIPALVEAGFETLVEAGFPPELAYFECYYEVQLVVNLMEEGGLEYMRKRISNTAEYGACQAASKIITPQVKKAMKEIMSKISDASFAKDFMAERDAGFATLLKKREETRNLLIEKVGKKLRKGLKL